MLVAHLILEWPREGMGHEIGVAPGGLGSSYPFCSESVVARLPHEDCVITAGDVRLSDIVRENGRV